MPTLFIQSRYQILLKKLTTEESQIIQFKLNLNS